MGRLARLTRAGAAVAVLGSVTGCFWPVPGQGPNRQAHNPFEEAISPETVVNLTHAWDAQVDDGAAGDPISSSRAIHVSDTRSVYGFDRTTGTRLWEHGLSAPDTVGQPFFAGDRLQVNQVTDVGTSDASGRTVELDPGTGAVLDETSQRVIAFRGSRVLGLQETRHFRLSIWFSVIGLVDTSTGDRLCCGGWFRVGGVQDPVPPLTLGSTHVLHGGPGKTPDMEIDDPSVNAVRGFTIEDDGVPCEAEPNYLCPNWATPTDGTTTTVPVLSDDETTAYAGTDAGTLYAVDTTTGEVRWSAPVGSAVTDAPALAHGTLFVPTAGGDLVALAADGCGAPACAPLWSAPTGSEITRQPAVAGGVAFTGSTDGSVAGFDASGCGAATCPPLWSASTGSEITGAPAVSQGRLYVGTADGRLVAYGLPVTAG